MRWMLVAALLVACSNDEEEKKQECVGYENELREAAAEYGVPERGACNNPTVAVPFKAKCDQLAKCNAELAELRD